VWRDPEVSISQASARVIVQEVKYENGRPHLALRAAALLQRIPSGLVATAELTPSNNVHLVVWNPSSNADHYEVQRRQNGDPFSTINPNWSANVFDDFTVLNNTAYVYRVRAVDAQSICPSEYSAVDLATTTNFPEIIASGVPIKATRWSPSTERA
jgi:hypothetical protein